MKYNSKVTTRNMAVEFGYCLQRSRIKALKGVGQKSRKMASYGGTGEMERVDNEVIVLCGGEWIQIAAPARPRIPAVSCHGDETTRPLLLTVTPRATEGPAGLVSI